MPIVAVFTSAELMWPRTWMAGSLAWYVRSYSIAATPAPCISPS